MVEAAKSALPSCRCKAILKHFANFPLHLQCTAVTKVHIFEGAYSNYQRDHYGALQSFKSAADIGYTVRGNGDFGYLTDLWHVVGAAMSCKRVDVASETLVKFWNAQDFQSLP